MASFLAPRSSASIGRCGRDRITRRGSAARPAATPIPRPDAPMARLSPSSNGTTTSSSSPARRRTGGSERRCKGAAPLPAATGAGAGAGKDNDASSSGDSGASLQSLKGKLAAYGVAGMVAYGTLNTLYYTVAFVAAWFFLQPNGPPVGGQGWGGAVKAAGLVMAGTWVGSQVTKLARAAGAVALAPVVDGLLERVGARLGGKRRAAAAVVGGCLCVWAAVFLAVLASVA